jgi:hypothetical protein
MDYPKSDPTIGLVGGKFSDGDPAGGIPASRDPAAWANLTTDELLNILTAFGVTPDEANNHQLIDALLANFAGIGGNATQLFRALTAAQFDSSSQVATTEFVKRALGNYSGRQDLAATTTLTAAALGNFIRVAADAPFTVTLPLVSQSPAGSRLEFGNQGVASITIARQGADPLNYSDGASIGASFLLYPGDTIILESSWSAWFMCGGSRALGNASGQFGASLSTSPSNGYQKLPSGIILQVGVSAAPASSGAAVPITFPLAFPVVCSGLFLLQTYDSTTPASAWADTITQTGANLRGSIAGNIIYWFAIGR